MPSDDGPATKQVEDALGQEIMRIHRESYGNGARTANVHYVGDDVVCFLDELELMPNEEFLIEAGQGDAVVSVRSRFQQAIETTFRAAVERATGRRVTAFLSATHLSPNFAVEIFRLGPAKENALEEITDG
jgi:uncharacterized protein YbcI